MANGDILVTWNASELDPDGTNFPQPEVVNNRQYQSFDATTNELGYFEGVMPSHYAGGGVTVQLICLSRSATSGTLEWEVSFERQNNGLALGSDSFAASQNVTITLAVANQIIDASNTIAFTDGAQMDSVAAGEAFRIKLERDATTDTAASDCAIYKVVIKET